MRSELEADERHPDRADPPATRRSQLEEISALQALIDDMLVLARSDAGFTGPAHVTLDLDDIVREEVTALGSGIAVDASRLSAAQIVGDPGDLRRAVRNLLDNARRHARTAIAVGLVEHGGTATLTIDDDGAGIPPERRSDVFERFTKLDESRRGGEGRSGLGLAIVAEIVGAHGGTVSITDSPLGGARLTVTLPSGDGDRARSGTGG
jgi:signal transduction histidine kinase